VETHFHQQLQKLRLKVLEMAAHSRTAIETAVRALQHRDADAARSVIAGDKLINTIECEIDELSFRLLALDQPMAVDLRIIVAIMRASMYLERVGDEAVNIAEAAMFLASRPPLPEMPSLNELGTHAVDMFRKAVMSFRESDAGLARELRMLDKRCNQLDVQVLRELMDYMSRESPAVERAVHTILVSRSLERVGDLSTNVGETVMFIVEGLNIKHSFQINSGGACS
jgi:phosphate transport system protein